MSGQAEQNPLVPDICCITAISEETPDTKTFRVQTLAGGRPFTPLPGQLAMISLFGVGEAMFSITAQGSDFLDFAIKRCGTLTDALHEVRPGQQIGLRGPYGNHFPLQQAKSQDLLFIGGGIGLAPLRSFIRYALEHRADYGKIDIVYGARSPQDLVFRKDLLELWPQEPDAQVHITVDSADTEWQGPVGFVPPYVRKLGFAPQNRLAVVCGPPVMITKTIDTLAEMGFIPKQIVTTLEMRMKCGIGKCGRCNIGSKYVCLDGPVFFLAELNGLPREY